MGGAKDYMMELEDLRAMARRLLVQAEVLTACEGHGILYNPEAVDLQTAYKIANAKVTAGEIDLRKWSRRDFTDAIKHEFEENGALDYCSQCAKNMTED